MTCVYVRAMHAIVEIRMENMDVVCCFYDDRMLVVLSLSLFEMCVCVCAIGIITMLWYSVVHLPYFFPLLSVIAHCVLIRSLTPSFSLVQAFTLTILRCFFFLSFSSLWCPLLFSSDTHFIRTLFLDVIFFFFHFSLRFSMLMLLVCSLHYFLLAQIRAKCMAFVCTKGRCVDRFWHASWAFRPVWCQNTNNVFFFFQWQMTINSSDVFQRLEMVNFHPKPI